MSNISEEMMFVNVFHGVITVSDFVRGKQKWLLFAGVTQLLLH